MSEAAYNLFAPRRGNKPVVSFQSALQRFQGKYGGPIPIPSDALVPHLCFTLNLTPNDLAELDEETIMLMLAYRDGMRLGEWLAYEHAKEK